MAWKARSVEAGAVAAQRPGVSVVPPPAAAVAAAEKSLVAKSLTLAPFLVAASYPAGHPAVVGVLAAHQVESWVALSP